MDGPKWCGAFDVRMMKYKNESTKGDMFEISVPLNLYPPQTVMAGRAREKCYCQFPEPFAYNHQHWLFTHRVKLYSDHVSRLIHANIHVAPYFVLLYMSNTCIPLHSYKPYSGFFRWVILWICELNSSCENFPCATLTSVAMSTSIQSHSRKFSCE